MIPGSLPRLPRRSLMIRRSLAGALTALAALTCAPPASAYPVDCAILLCLAGGFPPSEPCLRAKAVMMQRILSIPFQPPLQIWNCPLQASSWSDGPDTGVNEIRSGTTIGWDPDPSGIVERAAGSGMDFSGPEYAFLRSLRVIRLQYRQQMGTDGFCAREPRIAIGRYDRRADFHWGPGRTADIPRTSDFRPGPGCRPYAYRSIMIDWQDVSGNPGFEEVRY